jgi:hypothetical protein
MLKFKGAFLAQMTSFTDLQTAIGRALGLIAVISFLYAVMVIISALTGERAHGEWKFGVVRAIGIFAAVLIANILFAVFYPSAAPIQVQFH